LNEFAPPRQLNRSASNLNMRIIFSSALVLLCFVGSFSARSLTPTIEQSQVRRSFSIPLSSNATKSSRQLSAAYRFLWHSWQRKQRAAIDVTFWGTDAGAVHTVYLKPDESGRWTITEYARHYQLPEREPEPDKLIASGVSLRPARLRNGAFVVRLITESGTTLPLFR
jgi:hypothetical protein